jgi:putative intracellular protease/amidase
MKKIIIFSIIIFILIVSVGCQDTERKEINALLLVSRNYGLNYFLMRDNFDEYGWSITFAGVRDTITACPPISEQLSIHPIIPEVIVHDIENIENYDCIVIPPGSGNYLPVPNAFGDLLDSEESLKLISNAVEKRIPVYAMCSGVRLLAKADVIKGRKVSGATKFREEYEAAGAIYVGEDHSPVIDGSIITSARGLYNNFVNCQAIATSIEKRQGKGQKKKLSKAIITEEDIEFTEDDVLWAKSYGGVYADGGRALCETKDGGFLITGYTYSHGSGDADILVMKTDSYGNIAWTKSYGGVGSEYGNGCIEIEDGFLIVGYTTSFGAGFKDVYLIKTDKNGNEVWAKTYGGPSWDVGMSVCETNDGALLVCGYTQSYGAGEEDIYIIKVDFNGNELHSKTYGGERSEIGYSVGRTYNGYFIGANTGTYGGGNTDFYFIKTDSKFNELWMKSYGTEGRGHGFDWCNSVFPTSDEGFILTGYSDCSDIQDIHVIKIDKEGNKEWSKTFGNKPFYDYGNAAVEAKDGNYLIVGTTKSIVNNKNIYNNDIFLVELDSKGNVIREKAFGEENYDWGSSLVISKDGNVVILGSTKSYGKGSFDVCLIKVKDY